MKASTIDRAPLRALLGAACAVIVLAGMRAAASLVTTVCIAWILAYSVAPFTGALMRRRVPAAAAVSLTIVAVLAGGAGIASVLALSLARLAGILPVYREGLAAMTDGAARFLEARGIDATAVRSFDLLSPDRVVSFAGSMLGGLGQILGNAFVLAVLAVVFLVEFARSERERLRGAAAETSVISRFREASLSIRRYTAVIGGIGLLQSAAVFVLLAAIGVDFALTWAVLFFFLGFVPAIGFLVAILPPAFVAYLDSGWPAALGVIAGCVVINVLGDNVLKPKLVERGFDMPIAYAILSIVFWGWLLGSMGAIVAVPLSIVIGNLLRRAAEGERARTAPAAEETPPGTA